jgi:hypothetical protein
MPISAAASCESRRRSQWTCETRRDAVGQDLDDAAERVAVPLGRLDLVDHGRARRLVEAPQGVIVESIEVGGRREGRTVGNADGTDRERVTDELDAELGQERPGDGAQGHAGGGLTGARPLEDRPGLVEVVLLHPDEIGVPRAGACQRGAATTRGVADLDRLGVHHLDPLGPLGVADPEGDRAAHGQPVTDAARDVQFVLFELHARAAAVTETSTGQIGLDRARRDGHPRGEPLEDGDELGAV